MQTVTDTFLAALRYGHAIKTIATAYPPTGDPVDLPVEDGTITIDRTAAHRRQLALTVPPVYPSGHALEGQEVYPSNTTQAVNVYGTEIVVQTGIRFADEAVELVSQGIYRIEDVSRDLPGGDVTINGWDRSRQLLDARFFLPRKFTSQLATDLIQLLVSEVYPDAVFNITTSDTTTIHKHVVAQDRWPEIQRVAAVIGCEVFPDVNGVWVIQDAPDLATAESVWQVDAGASGVLISATDSVTREGAPNVVIALGESFNGRDGQVTIISDSSVGKGAWSSGTAYSVGDGVQDAPGTTEYVAIQAGTNHVPASSPSFWDTAGPGIIEMAKHEVVENQQVSFHTGGTLPHPLTQGTTYFVHSVVDANTFHISATRGGGSIATTASVTPNAVITMDIQGIPIHSQDPHGRDLDPLSPTYIFGAYGAVPRFYTNAHIRTQSHADLVADRQLADHLGATRLISFNAVSNPALDAGDCITVVRPDGTSERHLIDALTIPLSPSGEMTGETRAQNWNAT